LPEEVSDWIEEDYNGYFAYRTLMSFLKYDDLIGNGDSHEVEKKSGHMKLLRF
jgi:hypothetical protein